MVELYKFRSQYKWVFMCYNPSTIFMENCWRYHRNTWSWKIISEIQEESLFARSVNQTWAPVIINKEFMLDRFIFTRAHLHSNGLRPSATISIASSFNRNTNNSNNMNLSWTLKNNNKMQGNRVYKSNHNSKCHLFIMFVW